MKKAVAIGAISASLLAGAAVGGMLGTPALVGAQDAPTTEAPAPDASAPEQARDWVRQALDDLVADGTLTTEQADAVANKLAESRPERGPGGPGGPGHGRHGKGPGLEAAATALGIEPSELMTQLRDGKTIAQVAADKGVDVQTVIDAMVADMSTHLDEEVAEGDLTQEEADARKAEATERITEMVNNGMPAGGPMGRGGKGHHDDDAPDDGAVEAPTTEDTQGA
ncbi:MAG: hypothetical protein KDB36_02385 [Acidimicrobiales bacterium]|nr:hypothetical protein [Acidimicrobiales bacterium]